MKVDLSSYIPCSYEEAVEQVKTPRLLQHVAFPLVSFTPFTPNCMPTFLPSPAGTMAAPGCAPVCLSNR
jgi:hypothetical protein